jgi:hypothetical protein
VTQRSQELDPTCFRYGPSREHVIAYSLGGEATRSRPEGSGRLKPARRSRELTVLVVELRESFRIMRP